MTKLAKEVAYKIYDLYINEGMSQDAIANTLGIHRSTVIRNLKKYRDDPKFIARKESNRSTARIKANNTIYSSLRIAIIDKFRNTTLTITETAKLLHTSATTVHRTLLQFGGYTREGLHTEVLKRVKLYMKQFSVRSDVINNGRYNTALVPDNCSRVYKKGYMGEHSRVVCEHLGLTEIPKGFVVRHVNNDSKDNRFENLVLLTRSEHTSLHRRYYAKGVTTISKESTLKWVEARRQGVSQDILDDIVYSEQECSAAV